MKENGIEGEYMVPYTLRKITQGVAKWREIHKAIQGWNGTNAWDEFKTILLRSRLTRKQVDLKRRSLVLVRFVEKWDTPIKNTRMNAQIAEEVTQLKNAQLGRLLVSCVKGFPTILLSVTFTPWCNEPSSRRKK